MLSNDLKPINIICVLFYILFMAIAIDSDVVNALVFYITESGEEVTYTSGNVQTAPLNNSQNNSIAAIQYTKDKSLSSLPDEQKPLSKTETSISYSEKEKNTSATTQNKKSNLDNSVYIPSSILDYIKAVETMDWEYASLLDRYIIQYDPDTYLVLTIKPSLQKALEEVFAKNTTRIGAGIIQDPSTGEILAMTSSHRNQILPIESLGFKTENWALKPTFPVASLFKIVVTAAGIDTGKLEANSRFKAWQQAQMTVWRAFATSHNGVFGNMARTIGHATLKEYAKKFGFNREFFFDLPVSNSIAELPASPERMGQSAAGLNKEFLTSPIHVSSIVSTVLNRGITMKPYLLDYVVHKNRVIYRREPFELQQTIKVDTARDIYKMFYATTAVGTGKKGFGSYSDCQELPKMCGGKTGTLTGSSPNYLYTWFAGFTKVTGRTLSIVTLSGQPNHSGVKASSIAAEFSHKLWKEANPVQQRYAAER